MPEYYVVTFPALTEPERVLCEAAARGAWADFRTGDAAEDDVAGAGAWGQERAVRAEVLRALLLGAGEREPGSVPAVRLRGARITGRLDLMGASVALPLVCEYCRFEEQPRLVEASTRTVRIVGSFLPGFNGTRMRLQGILNLWQCAIPGLVRLDQAKITGLVSVGHATIGTPGVTPQALAADGLVVDGGFELCGLTAFGLVSMQVAVISGSLDLTNAHIENPGQRAFIASRAQIGGQLSGRRMIVAGEARMHNCRVAASLGLQGAMLSNPGGYAIAAGGLTVDGGVFCTDGFAAVGEVLLIGAQLRANLTLSGATLSNPGGIALNLDQARVRSLSAAGVTTSGEVNLTNTQIDGDLDLADARLEGSGGKPALFADRASVGGALVLARVHASGEVSMRSVQVGQRVQLVDARLENAGGIALRMSRAHVAADVFCTGMTATGGVRLIGATIGAELNFMRARITNPGGTAIDAAGLHAAELSLRTAEPIEGLVNLRHARVDVIRDDPSRWPGSLSLDGITYRALEPQIPARERLDWLARDPDGHQPQPYEQLAAHYNAIGQQAQARRILYARERAQVAVKTPLARIWSRLQDVTVGYGYKPWRALAWLTLLLAAGSIVFAVSPPHALQAGAAPHFNPVIYTLDLLLPVVDLGQKHAFNPAGADQWLSYFLVAAGWVLVTTVAAGTARVLSRH
jgi:hypothetical protein